DARPLLDEPRHRRVIEVRHAARHRQSIDLRRHAAHHGGHAALLGKARVAVHVLEHEPDGEARVERTVQDEPGELVVAGVGAPGRRLDDLDGACRIHPRLGGHRHRFDGEGENPRRAHVVDELDGMAGAHRSRVEDVLAHGLEHGPRPLEKLGGAPAPDGERALGRPPPAARDGSVDEMSALRLHLRRQLAGGRRVGRGHLEAESARDESREKARGTFEDEADFTRRGHDGDDGSRGRGDGRGRVGPARSASPEGLSRARPRIVHDERIARGQQAVRHGRPHVSQPDESDGLHGYLPSLPYTTGAMLLGLALVCVAAVSWGTTGSVMSLLAKDGSPSPLLVGWARMAGAAPCLLLATYLIRSGLASSERASRPAGRWTWMDRARAAVLGIAMAAYQLCYFWAVPRTGVALTALLA